MKHPSIKSKLRAGEKLNGCWIESFSPIATEIMALSGYDTGMIDLEHGAGSFLDAISMMQALDANGCRPMIRATSADHAVLKRVLDIGPQGMMVPNIRNVEEARNVVAGCRYGPRGVRGAAPVLLRATDYGKRVDGYEQQMDEDFLLIGQIESKRPLIKSTPLPPSMGSTCFLLVPLTSRPPWARWDNSIAIHLLTLLNGSKKRRSTRASFSAVFRLPHGAVNVFLGTAIIWCSRDLIRCCYGARLSRMSKTCKRRVTPHLAVKTTAAGAFNSDGFHRSKQRNVCKISRG